MEENTIPNPVSVKCTRTLVVQTVRCLPAVRETWVQSLGWEDSLEKERQPTPVFLPGKSHRWRSLTGYNPKGHKDLDRTEWLHFRYPARLKVFLDPNALQDPTYVILCLFPESDQAHGFSFLQWRLYSISCPRALYLVPKTTMIFFTAIFSERRNI